MSLKILLGESRAFSELTQALQLSEYSPGLDVVSPDKIGSRLQDPMYDFDVALVPDTFPGQGSWSGRTMIREARTLGIETPMFLLIPHYTKTNLSGVEATGVFCKDAPDYVSNVLGILSIYDFTEEQEEFL